MTDRLAEIKLHRENGYGLVDAATGEAHQFGSRLEDIDWLIAEVERLRRALAEAARIHQEATPETVEEMAQEIGRLQARITDRQREDRERFRKEMEPYRHD